MYEYKIIAVLKSYYLQRIFIFIQIKDQATSGFQAFIVHYRDDPDQQNLIDWIQERWVRAIFSFNEIIFF